MQLLEVLCTYKVDEVGHFKTARPEKATSINLESFKERARNACGEESESENAC